MSETSYAQRLAAALDVPEERTAWTAEHRARIKDLAAHLQVTPQAVDKYFRDSSKAMSAYNSSRAARFLRVDPDWLATGDGQMRSPRAWPFGPALPPEDFFLLRPEDVRPALDVLLAAVDRRRAAANSANLKTG